jgi:hypothetical protein
LKIDFQIILGFSNQWGVCQLEIAVELDGGGEGARGGAVLLAAQEEVRHAG